MLASVLASLSVSIVARAAEPAAAPWLEVVPLVRHEDLMEQYYGQSSAVSGNLLVVGADDASSGIKEAQGAVYTFERRAGEWQQVGVPLQTADGAAQDSFGSRVALWQNTLAVAAVEKSIAGVFRAGAVYVFERSGDSWSVPIRLTAPIPVESEIFGYQLAVVGDLLVASAGSRVYTFVRRNAGWVLQGDPLEAPLPLHDFPSSVALSPHPADRRGVLAIAAMGEFETNATGVVYVYGMGADGRWHEQASLTSSTASNTFGRAVAVYGDTLLVGDEMIGDGTGKVSVFTRDAAGSWSLTDEWPGDRPNCNFGAQLGVWGKQAIVGAPQQQFSDGLGRGALFLYERQGNAWSRSGGAQRVAPSEDRAIAQSVSLSGPNAVTGAHNIDGAAYALRTCASGPCCSTDSECAGDKYCAHAGACQPRVAAGDPCDCFEPGCRVCLEASCGECTFDPPPLVDPSPDAGSAGEGGAAGDMNLNEGGTTSAGQPHSGGSAVAGHTNSAGHMNGAGHSNSAGTANAGGAASGAPSAIGGAAAIDDDEVSSAACGCRVARPSSSASAFVSLGVALAWVARRRRRACMLRAP